LSNGCGNQDQLCDEQQEFHGSPSGDGLPAMVRRRADNGRFPEDPMANREQRSNREKKKPKQPNKPSPTPGTPQPWKK